MVMRCKQIQSIVDEVGDLDRLPVEAARHVAGCVACEQFGRDLVALRTLLRSPDRVVAPADFDDRLALRLRNARTTPESARPRFAWFAMPTQALASAAAVALIAAGSFAVYQVSRPTNANLTGPKVVTVANGDTAQPTSPSSKIASPPVSDEPSPTGAGVPVPVSTGHVRPLRPAPRTAVRENRPEEAMLLISDGGGTRVVSVPSVLVGSERLVPSSSSTASTADASVAF